MEGIFLMEWISVKERLPKAGSKVLCLGENTEIFLCDYISFHVPTQSDFEFCSTDWNHGEYQTQPNITHWMPLPEPPNDH